MTSRITQQLAREAASRQQQAADIIGTLPPLSTGEDRRACLVEARAARTAAHIIDQIHEWIKEGTAGLEFVVETAKGNHGLSRADRNRLNLPPDDWPRFIRALDQVHDSLVRLGLHVRVESGLITTPLNDKHLLSVPFRRLVVKQPEDAEK